MRFQCGATTLVLLACYSPLAAQSRTTWIVGAGISVPSGEFDKFAEVGRVIDVGVEHAMKSQPVSFRLDAFIANNKHDDVPEFDDRTKITGVNVSFVYRVSSRLLHFYIVAGGGYFNDHFSTNDPNDNSEGTGAQAALHEGAGLAIGTGKTQFFVEGRYAFGLTTAGPHFMPMMAGLRFGSKN